MAIQLHALLCGLAAIVFAAHLQQPRQLVYWLIALLAGALLLSPFIWSPPLLTVLPPQAGLLTGLAALWLIRRPQGAVALCLSGGWTALWMTALWQQNLPSVLSVLIPLVATAATLLLVRVSPGFATSVLRSEALLLLSAIALLVTLVPDLIDGWRSASALQGLDADAADTTSARDSLLVAAVCVLAGILYGCYRRRKYS